MDVAERLARDGRRVILAGLDQDYLGRPFEPVPQLMAVAEHVTKLHAVCVRCGAPANHSQRIVAEGARVLVGETEAYEPRCRRCFTTEAVAAQPVALPAETRPAPLPPADAGHPLGDGADQPVRATSDDPRLSL